MAQYTLGIRTTGVASGAAAWEIRAAATDRAYLHELGIFLAGATASTFGLGRPAAIGVTPTSPVTFVTTDDPGAPASTVQSALAWATGPTVPAAFMRRIALPATIGTGIIWTFPKQILIPVNSSLVVWNLAANAAADCFAVVDD